MELLKSLNSILHVISASLSLIIGAIVLFGNKGDARHRKLGVWFFWLMIINNVTALFIMKAFGKWFFPHYLALAGLVFIIPGYIVTKFQTWKPWLRVHIICLVISYYLLIGGAINEFFLHVPPLRPYIINNHPIIGIVQSIAMFIFIGLLFYFLRKYRKFRNINTPS